MRGSLAKGMLLLVLGAGAGVLYGQSQASSPETPAHSNASRNQEEMHHATEPSGPLKITFGDKTVEWTSPSLGALPHTTITVYNEHAKSNQTYSGVPLIDLLTPMGRAGKAAWQGLPAVCCGRGRRRLSGGLFSG